MLGEAANATVPSTMNVQGQLNDLAGTPLPAGNRIIKFSIFDSDAGGNRLWPVLITGEEHTITTGNSGLWNATVGETYPIPDTTFRHSPLSLNIRVKDLSTAVTTTLRRITLNTGPYAFYSQYAAHADTAQYSASSGAWQIVDSLVATTALRGIIKGGAGNLHYGDSGHTIVNLGVACTTGRTDRTVGT